MSEPLLIILKFCLLALLYLFFFRVLRAVWVEIKGPANLAVSAGPPRQKNRTRRSVRKSKGANLKVIEPPESRGKRYELEGEVTLGRAAGCVIPIDDTYVSQVHARAYQRDGQVLVEDLGSTNGTYLNRRRVTGTLVMKQGDQLQIGNTVLELQ